MEHSLPYEDWYGNWRDALIVSGVFLAFVLGFVWPRGGMQWRNAGVYSAFAGAGVHTTPSPEDRCRGAAAGLTFLRQ